MGVFQIESRAQMASLRRTRPETLDDLTIQVAIVRPGPILGGAVNPYIARRQQMREDPDYVVPYDHPSLEPVLRDTLGTIIFQDQVLEVAIAFAGFSPGEAEGLRRAMSRKRSEAAIEAYHRALRGGRGTHPRRRPEVARAGLRDDHGVLGLRLPQGPRRRLRAARLPVDLAARALRPGVPVRAAQRAADGLLRVRHARPRGAAARDRAAAADVNASAVDLHDRRRRRSASASATSAACAPTRSPRWWRRARPAGRSARSATSPRAPGPGARRSRSSPGRARATRCAATAPPAARSCGSSGSPRPASRCPDGTQLSLPLDVPERAGAARARAVGGDDRRLRHHRADARRATRWRCCARELPAGTVSCRDLETLAHEDAGADRRPRRRPPAPGHGQGHRLPAARGRVRDRQPDRAAARLRAPPPARALRAAAARRPGGSRSCRSRAARSTSSSTACEPLKAPQGARRRGRLARGAGAPGGRGGRAGRLPDRGARRPVLRLRAAAMSRRRAHRAAPGNLPLPHGRPRLHARLRRARARASSSSPSAAGPGGARKRMASQSRRHPPARARQLRRSRCVVLGLGIPAAVIATVDDARRHPRGQRRATSRRPRSTGASCSASAARTATRSRPPTRSPRSARTSTTCARPRTSCSTRSRTAARAATARWPPTWSRARTPRTSPPSWPRPSGSPAGVDRSIPYTATKSSVRAVCHKSVLLQGFPPLLRCGAAQPLSSRRIRGAGDPGRWGESPWRSAAQSGASPSANPVSGRTRSTDRCQST